VADTPGDLLVVEISHRGKLITGDPFFTPGTPVVLEKKGSNEALPGDLAVVRVGKGRAHLVEVLGDAANVEAVIQGLLVEKGELGAREKRVNLTEPSLDGRVDLRELTTFTIDPETAKDFDDALSLRREGDGIRVWVHIADVSAYVRAGSVLDLGAAGRANSVYVPGRVAPMLPHALADDLCSLRPYVDRLCVTVEVPFDGNLQAGEPSFYRSIIRSDARLAYGEAERILAGREKAPSEEVLEGLRLADRITEELRRRRFGRGALRINTKEVTFSFDGQGGVEDAWFEGEPEAHRLVEELMILANESVAALLAGRRREGMFRIHEEPDPQAVALLLSKLAELGVPTPPAPPADEIGPTAAAELAAQIAERVTEYVEQTGRGVIAFPPLVLRSLKQARYAPYNLGHSGLASPAYCHFTSPIRRYADLVQHRALLNELGLDAEPLADDLPELAEHLSVRERASMQVEYLADEICLCWLLEKRLFVDGWESTFEGEITGLIGPGLFIRFGGVFDGFLPSRTLGDDRYEPSVLGTSLAGKRSGRTFSIGQKLQVQVTGMRRAEGKVELALVQGDASDPRGAPRVTRTGPATPAARPPLNRHSRRKQQQRRRRG
jgi:ribonuclease R